MSVGENHSMPSVCLHTRQSFALAIVMKYLGEAVKKRIRGRKQRHIISQSRGAQEIDGYHETDAEALGCTACVDAEGLLQL